MPITENECSYLHFHHGCFTDMGGLFSKDCWNKRFSVLGQNEITSENTRKYQTSMT